MNLHQKFQNQIEADVSSGENEVQKDFEQQVEKSAKASIQKLQKE